MMLDAKSREDGGKRERILDAIAKIAAELLAASSLDAALPQALAEVGEAVSADRVILLRNNFGADGKTSIRPCASWSAPDVQPRIPEFLKDDAAPPDAADAVISSIGPTEMFHAIPSAQQGDFSKFLQKLNVKSFVVFPILVEGKPWGYLAFDDCHQERLWTKPECDALRVLAGIIGASVMRERRIALLSEAQQIVDRSGTILFRAAAVAGLPLTYVSTNIRRWGYTPEQFTKDPFFYRTLVHPEDRERFTGWLVSLIENAPAEATIEFRAPLADGTYRWFESRVGSIRGAAGVVTAYEGTLQDIQDRKMADQAARQRDHILDAITRIAAVLLAAPSPDSAIPEVLHLAGEAAEVDRVIVLEKALSADGKASVRERYTWNAPGVEPAIVPGLLKAEPAVAALLATFFGSLPKGHIFTGHPHRLEGEVGRFLQALKIQSMLVVPISVEEEAWGYLGIDDCHQDRTWTTAESDALQVLADIIGASISRERRNAELSEAKRIVENTPTVLYRAALGSSLPLTYVSQNISRWGYRPEQFLEDPTFYSTLVHPDDQAEIARWMKDLQRGSTACGSKEFRVRFADGSYRWMENRVSSIRDAQGKLADFEGLILDIDERKRVEQKLDFAKTLLTTAMENMPGGFLVVDPSRRALAFNQQFVKMWNIPPEVAATHLESAMLEAVAPTVQDPPAFLSQIRYLNEHPELRIRDELAFRDGRRFERHSVSLYDSGNRYLGRIWFFSDVTERKRFERDLALLARTDPLTSLANRATFMERLELMFAATRRGASPFAVLYIDLDNFKDVNDTMGHGAGDALLKTAGQRIASSVRGTDLAARLGGDEFAVLQTDAEDPSMAGTLAAKIRTALADPYHLEGNELHINATIGIALYSADIQQPGELLTQADRALYRAKEEGRDRYRFHSPELDLLVHERIALSDELRRAIERDELELHYQPQIDIGTGRIVGVEALVRWNHPRRGQLRPNAFLPVAEKTGAIVPLGEWVLERACRQLRTWRDEGLAPPVMALNLSGVQLKVGREFHRKVNAALEKWKLAPQDLEFDVTEGVLAACSSAQPDTLEQLRDLGVRIAIDDFGSDYTSLGRVKAYHVKRFKIAGQFISSMTTDAVDAGLVRMMVGLARQLGIEIIAKSVETAAQRDFLRSLTDAAQGQGFYFSEPLDALRTTELLRSSQARLSRREEPELAGKLG